MEKHSQEKSEARGLSKGELARESTHNGGPVRGTPRERNLLDGGLQSADLQEALVSDRVLSDTGQILAWQGSPTTPGEESPPWAPESKEGSDSGRRMRPNTRDRDWN